MSDSLNNPEEDVMDILSVSDNFEITHEEESTLLEEDSMITDSPLKKSDNQSAKERKPIVFDLKDNSKDDEEDENEEDIRDKFRTERKTINFTLNENKRRQIPDSLDGLGTSFKRIKEYDSIGMSKKQRKRDRRNRRYRNSGQPIQQILNRGPDLRQFINNVNYQNNLQPNPFQFNQGLTPLLNYQIGLGIIHPVFAQNQMLTNALLAQSGANPLLSRLSFGGQNLSVLKNALKPKDDIQITVINENRQQTKETIPSNISRKTQTRSQIRCHVSKGDTTDSDIIEKGFPLMPPTVQTSQKKKMSTLFAQHLATKANQSKGQPESNSTSKRGLFGDALAEIEVGVDNEYLRRMEEQEKKRQEIQKFKEQRRLEMADERLESALQMKKRIGNHKN